MRRSFENSLRILKPDACNRGATVTPGLIDAVVALTLDPKLTDQQRFKQFERRAAACRDVLNHSAVSGEFLEERGWQRWRGKKLPIWMLDSTRILWTIEKGLVLILPGKMVSQS